MSGQPIAGLIERRQTQWATSRLFNDNRPKLRTFCTNVSNGSLAGRLRVRSS